MTKSLAEIRQEVLEAVLALLPPGERDKATVDDNTHLIRDLGLASEDGGDLHADLCERFGVELAPEVNPLVFPDGKHGRRFRHVVELIAKSLPASVEKTA